MGYKVSIKTISMMLQSDPIEEAIQYFHRVIDNEIAKPLCEMDCDLIDKEVNNIIMLREWKDEQEKIN